MHKHVYAFEWATVNNYIKFKAFENYLTFYLVLQFQCINHSNYSYSVVFIFITILKINCIFVRAQILMCYKKSKYYGGFTHC